MSSSLQEGCGLHNMVTAGLLNRATGTLSPGQGEVVTSYGPTRPSWDADDDEPYDDDDDDVFDDDDEDDEDDDEDDEDDDLDDEDDDDDLDDDDLDA